MQKQLKKLQDLLKNLEYKDDKNKIVPIPEGLYTDIEFLFYGIINDTEKELKQKIKEDIHYIWKKGITEKEILNLIK